MLPLLLHQLSNVLHVPWLGVRWTLVREKPTFDDLRLIDCLVRLDRIDGSRFGAGGSRTQSCGSASAGWWCRCTTIRRTPCTWLNVQFLIRIYVCFNCSFDEIIGWQQDLLAVSIPITLTSKENVTRKVRGDRACIYYTHGENWLFIRQFYRNSHWQKMQFIWFFCSATILKTTVSVIWSYLRTEIWPVIFASEHRLVLSSDWSKWPNTLFSLVQWQNLNPVNWAGARPGVPSRQIMWSYQN